MSLHAADDVLTIGLNRAVALVADGKRGRRAPAPLREIGPHPRGGKPVSVMDGRYGPYLQHDGINAPLPRPATPEAITLEDAVAQLDARGKPPKRRRRAAGKKATAKTPRKRAAAGE